MTRRESLAATPGVAGRQEPPDPYWIVVWASMALQGRPIIARGQEILVDVNDPYIQRRMAAGHLIPVGDEDELEAGQ